MRGVETARSLIYFFGPLHLLICLGYALGSWKSDHLAVLHQQTSHRMAQVCGTSVVYLGCRDLDFGGIRKRGRARGGSSGMVWSGLVLVGALLFALSLFLRVISILTFQ